jgi:hypothetical protein
MFPALVILCSLWGRKSSRTLERHAYFPAADQLFQETIARVRHSCRIPYSVVSRNLSLVASFVNQMRVRLTHPVRWIPERGLPENLSISESSEMDIRNMAKMTRSLYAGTLDN